jgi:hypothetical protein
MAGVILMRVLMAPVDTTVMFVFKNPSSQRQKLWILLCYLCCLFKESCRDQHNVAILGTLLHISSPDRDAPLLALSCG